MPLMVLRVAEIVNKSHLSDFRLKTVPDGECVLDLAYVCIEYLLRI
jgi:hypothetical protein